MSNGQGRSTIICRCSWLGTLAVKASNVSTFHIEPAALSGLQSKSLFYPAAGDDWGDFLSSFSDYVDEFHFCDITYDFSRLRSSLNCSWLQIGREQQGNSSSLIENRHNERRPYKYVEPGRLKEVYESKLDGKRLTVIRRRGFGQYALAEFPDRSIGVFVHRGDSPGDGGSNVYFFTDRKFDHAPLSNLFSKLSAKLADRALIVSDGSNARPRFLKRFHNKNVSGSDAFAMLQHQLFSFGPFAWRCVGFMTPRYGPTLVWRVERQQSS